MLKVLLVNHDNYYGIADVLRLFYSKVSEDRENNSVICPDAPDMTITSVVEGEVVTTTYGDMVISNNESDLAVKREVKRSLYELMTKITGETYPWGALTGIRPTIVAGEEATPEDMARKYMVRPDKAELAFRTYKEEESLLKLLPEDNLNIYIGVPFCPTRCEYCSFVAQEISHHLNRLSDYQAALAREIEIIAPKIDRPISSIYMGGGTPTVFSDEDMEKILTKIRESFPWNDSLEFTIEAGRPDTITERKLIAMKKAGVTRLCINPQTMNSETLAKLNRKHSADDVRNVYKMATELGFDVINMDLIAGLKYEDADELITSLKEIIKLDPANITIHTLYKKKNAAMSKTDVLDRANSRGDIDTNLSEAYRILDSYGYEPYYMYRQKDTGHGLENVGWAKKGTGCLYNVAMMSDKRNVLSFGAGSMSKRIFENNRLERCASIKDVSSYMRQVEDVATKKLEFYNMSGVE